MFQFIQIGVQVLRGKLVIRPDDRALKQAPHALYAVGVNITAHPFVLGVVDRFVTRVRVFYPSVVPILICVDRLAFWVSRFFHKLSELKSIAVRNDRPAKGIDYMLASHYNRYGVHMAYFRLLALLVAGGVSAYYFGAGASLLVVVVALALGSVQSFSHFFRGSPACGPRVIQARP